MDTVCYKGEGVMVIEKGKKERSTWENVQGESFSIDIVLENENFEFCELFQSARLKA